MCRPACRPVRTWPTSACWATIRWRISPAALRWKPPRRELQLGAEDWAIRCNLVTVADQTMRDFTAGHITTEEARQLLAAAQEKLGSDRLQFYPGVSYRNLLVYRGAGQKPPFSVDTRATPPHDLTDKSVLDDYPAGPAATC